MITSEQLLENRSITEPIVATLFLEVPWNETNYGNILRSFFDNVTEEVFDNTEILEYEPISYDSEKQTFQIKYTLGVVDLLETIGA